jgi:ABC-type molybdate transport system substrate-binding protein
VLKESKNQKVAQAFVAYVLAAKAQGVLATAGFGKP